MAWGRDDRLGLGLGLGLMVRFSFVVWVLIIDPLWIIIRFWETAHLLCPKWEVSVNVGLGEG